MNQIYFVDGPREGETIQVAEVYGDRYRVVVYTPFASRCEDWVPDSCRTVDYKLACVIDPTGGYDPTQKRCFIATVV